MLSPNSEIFKYLESKGIYDIPRYWESLPDSIKIDIEYLIQLKKDKNKDKNKDEMVVKPSHYCKFVIEPVTFVMKNKIDFALGNAVKYITRAGSKKYDDLSLKNSEIRDLKKAIRYLEMKINLINGEEVL